MLANEFIRLPYQFVGWRAPGVPRWGRAHKEYMRQWYRRSIGVMGPVQEMPVFESRVQVDPKVKDYWGIPVVRLSGHRHPNDQVVGQVPSFQSRGVAQGGRGDYHLDVPAWLRPERRPASGWHLPHGRRSADLGRRYQQGA